MVTTLGVVSTTSPDTWRLKAMSVKTVVGWRVLRHATPIPGRCREANRHRRGDLHAERSGRGNPTQRAIVLTIVFFVAHQSTGQTLIMIRWLWCLFVCTHTHTTPDGGVISFGRHIDTTPARGL